MDLKGKMTFDYVQENDSVHISMTLENGSHAEWDIGRKQLANMVDAVETEAAASGIDKTSLTNTESKREFKVLSGKLVSMEDSQNRNTTFSKEIENHLNDGWVLHGDLNILPTGSPGWYVVFQSLMRVKQHG